MVYEPGVGGYPVINSSASVPVELRITSSFAQGPLVHGWDVDSVLYIPRMQRICLNCKPAMARVLPCVTASVRKVRDVSMLCGVAKDRPPIDTI